MRMLYFVILLRRGRL